MHGSGWFRGRYRVVMLALMVALTAMFANVHGRGTSDGGRHVRREALHGWDRARSPSLERVLVIGGSVARGEKDPQLNGYVQRAFSSLQRRTGISYVTYNEAIVGANSTQLATMYKGYYRRWLEQIRPNVVVISWGLLNDALPRTPADQFQQLLRGEIVAALQRRAVVFVVTPPVTEVALTQYKAPMRSYMLEELQVVRRLHNPNVAGFDLFAQMLRYLEVHHQSIRLYAADAHHPNRQGHILAANLLCDDILQRYAGGLIRFVSQDLR
ncbi:MAG: SGNH/GDSL hydrolase family protein [Alicyclobacillaceae bacterium]|nr:SGNH/GDSL hydrolase family protein [Alicyclobacillaceae bacterium]